MRSVINPIISYVKQLGYLSVYKNISKYNLIENVPYYSQWESPELVASILAGDIQAEDDPRWRESGAIDKVEYNIWSQSACGMACTKMEISHKLNKIIPIVELGKKCADYGGYKISPNNVSGLIYKPYVNFIKSEYNLDAKAVSHLSIAQILKELHDGRFVIASVNYDIRNPRLTPMQKGGHLVLVLGYDMYKKIIYFHNPSGNMIENQQYATVSFADFDKFFAGRGIGYIKLKRNSP